MAGVKKGLKRGEARELIEEHLKSVFFNGAQSVEFGVQVNEQYTFGDLVRALVPKKAGGGRRPTRQELLEAINSGDPAMIADVANREREAQKMDS